MAQDYNPEIAAAIRAFLGEKDWQYLFQKKKGLFHFYTRIRGTLGKIQYIVEVFQDSYLVVAYSPLFAKPDDPAQMKNMAEFVCHANYRSLCGNFNLDFDDGELHYKCYVNCEGIQPSQAVIRYSIYRPAEMFTRYNDAIVQIMVNDMPASEAVARCEEAELSDPEPDDQETDIMQWIRNMPIPPAEKPGDGEQE